MSKIIIETKNEILHFTGPLTFIINGKHFVLSETDYIQIPIYGIKNGQTFTKIKNFNNNKYTSDLQFTNLYDDNIKPLNVAIEDVDDFHDLFEY